MRVTMSNIQTKLLLSDEGEYPEWFKGEHSEWFRFRNINKWIHKFWKPRIIGMDVGKYEGEWKDGQMHGKGTLRISRIERGFRNFCQPPFGWKLIDEGEYVGEWKYGKENGKGIRFYRAGLMNVDNGKYEAWVDYGRQPTGVDVLEWAKRVVDLGVGEIFLSSVDKDGTGEGFELDLIHMVASSVSIPVIACSGAGQEEDFVQAVKIGLADAVSAASVFHYKYAEPVDTLNMSYNEKELRMGEQIDSGNIEFIRDGYGDSSEIFVNPASIGEVKELMRDEEIFVRV